MERATGIGGVFFRPRDPERLRAWYRDHLGIDFEDWGGHVFRAEADAVLVWAPFASETEYFEGPLMINYRVRDLDAMLEQLRASGVDVVRETHEDENGRFGWAFDCEGNRFELWQPAPGY